MRTNLLDLSDETLQFIAYFLHGDYEVPMPSFNPHWANFKREIDPKVQKSFLAFRATCRRLHKACPLKGLHLKVTKWSTVLKMPNEAPTTVLKAVRRLILDIPPTSLGAAAPGEDDEQQVQQEWSLAVTWTLLHHFLYTLSSLEEIIITRSPVCQHKPPALETARLICPPYDFLPSLRSISFEMTCQPCAMALPELFIPPAPKLRHLKMAQIEAGKLVGISRSFSERHSTAYLPLETLILRVEFAIYLVEEMMDLHDSCPDLKELHLIPPEDDPPYLLSAGLSLAAMAAENDQPHNWVVKAVMGQWVGNFDSLVADVAAWERDITWGLFKSTLAGFQRLHTFDCVAQITIGHEIPLEVSINRSGSRSDHLGRISRVRSDRARFGSYEERLLSAIRKAAQDLVDVVPSLQTGYFWQHDYVSFGSSQNRWHRYQWYRNTSSASSDAIVVEPIPEMMLDRWTLCIDGQILPEEYE